MSVTGLVVPVSGPYTATWNAFALGTQNDDGFVLAGSFQGQEVNQSDAYGMTLVEAIFRGINWRLRFRGLEWNKPGILAAMQAYGSVGAASETFTPTLGTIGTRSSAVAQPMILTAILGPMISVPQTLTALGAIPAPQSNFEYLMTSKVREAPFEMALLPYVSVVGSVSNKQHFTTT